MAKSPEKVGRDKFWGPLTDEKMSKKWSLAKKSGFLATFKTPKWAERFEEEWLKMGKNATKM